MTSRFRFRQLVGVLVLGASASLVGQRAVESPVEPVTVAAPSCGDDVSCWSASLRAVTRDQSPQQALAVLNRAVADGFLDEFTCHDVAHAVGQETAARERRDVLGEAFTHADTSCGAGFYHGVVVEVSARSSLEEFTSGLSQLCPETVDWQVFPLWSCGHGVGHGLAFLHADVASAAESCASLSGPMRAGCFSGVLMQDLNDHMADPERLADPFQACVVSETMPVEVVDEFVDGCFDMHAGFLTRAVGFEDGLRECVSVMRPLVCATGVGRQVHNGAPLQADISTICRAAGDELFAACLQGAAENTFAYFGAAEPALAVCEVLEAADAQLCREFVARLA